jgi:cathepsin L
MRSFALAVIASLGGAKLFDEVDLAFMNYIAKHNKNYANLDEFNLRFENFAKFDTDIKHFNSIQSDSFHAHNEFSDWTDEERKALTGYVEDGESLLETTPFVNNTVGIPTSINWCTSGACNPIQAQGGCGSCWAFSAVAAMESAK